MCNGGAEILEEFNIGGPCMVVTYNFMYYNSCTVAFDSKCDFSFGYELKHFPHHKSGKTQLLYIPLTSKLQLNKGSKNTLLPLNHMYAKFLALLRQTLMD